MGSPICRRASSSSCGPKCRGNVDFRGAKILVTVSDEARRGSCWAAGGVEKKSASPSFMELVAPEAAAVAQCSIEMEGRRARIRIELKAGAAEVVSFSRALAELVL